MRTSVLVVVVVAVTIPPPAALSQPSDDSARRALTFFQTLLTNGPNVALDHFRTEPPPKVERERAFDVLPLEGDLEPTIEESAKLDQVRELFRYRGRGDITLIVIDIPQAFVGLHARAILLVSRPALRLVSGEEIQALAAHELGHDTMWNDYWSARNGKDWAALRGVELRCDGVAVLTLASMGRDPRALGRAVDKVTRFNMKLGATADAGHYPSIAARIAFIQDVTGLIIASSGRLTRR